jgi:hypothetical protein
MLQPVRQWLLRRRHGRPQSHWKQTRPLAPPTLGKEVSSTTFGFIYIRRVLQPFEGQDMGVTALGQTLNKPRSRWLYSPMFGATKGKSLSLTPIQRASVAAS